MPDGPDCSAAHKIAFFRWYYAKRNAGLLEFSSVDEDRILTRLAGRDEPRLLGDKVLAVRLNAAPVSVKRLRIRFGPRREKELVVPEVEVWGQEAQP